MGNRPKAVAATPPVATQSGKAPASEPARPMATPCRGAGAGAQGEGVDIPLQGHGVEPTPGVLRLSENAINLRVRRVLQPNCKGEFKVSESIRKMYTDKRGGGKDKLLQIFQSCGFDPDRGSEYRIFCVFLGEITDTYVFTIKSMMYHC